jgi:hypothetical protein
MQSNDTARDGLSDRERDRRARQRAASLADRLSEPLAVSIEAAAIATGESDWTVKHRLRNGQYKAKKAGRRTLIDYQSIKDFWATLPEAKFLPPRRRRAKAQAAIDETVAARRADAEAQAATKASKTKKETAPRSRLARSHENEVIP